MWGTKQIPTMHLHRSATYADVVKYYDEEKMVKRTDPTTKWLTHNHTQHVTRHADGTIAFCLRRQELVCFHPDDTISVKLHRPNDNDLAFINALTSNLLSFCPALAGDRDVVGIFDERGHWRYWKVGEAPVLALRDGAWTVTTPTRPFWVPRLDRKAATDALRRSGARDFATWATAIAELGAWRPYDAGEEVNFFNPNREDYREQILKVLAAPDQWFTLFNAPSMTGYATDGSTAAKRCILAVRRAVYANTPGVITWETHDCLDTKLVALHTYENASKEYCYARPR